MVVLPARALSLTMVLAVSFAFVTCRTGKPGSLRVSDDQPAQQPLRMGRVPADAGESCGDTDLEGRVRYALARAQLEGEHTPLVAEILTDLAAICRHHGRTQRAIELLDRAVLILEVSTGDANPQLAKVLVFMAELRRHEGDAAPAERAYLRALAIIEESRGPTHPNIAVCATGLGGLYFQQARLADAEGMYRRALAVERQRAGGEDGIDVATAERNLALVLRRRHRIAEAGDLLRRAQHIFAQTLAPNDPLLVHVAQERASLQRSSQPPD